MIEGVPNQRKENSEDAAFKEWAARIDREVGVPKAPEFYNEAFKLIHTEDVTTETIFKNIKLLEELQPDFPHSEDLRSALTLLRNSIQ